MEQSDIKEPENRRNIILTHKSEVKWWCRYLGVSEAVLKDLVKKVGTSPARIRAYIKVNGLTGK